MARLDDLLTAYRDATVGGWENIGMLGSAIAAEPVAGLAGLGELALGRGGAKAAERVRKLRESLTYQPRTDIGRRGAENIGKGIETAKDVAMAAPGARTAQAGWEGLTVASPLTAAVIAGVANVAEPKGLKGASRAAKAAEHATEVAKTAERAATLGKPAPQRLADLSTPEGVEAFRAQYGRDPLHLMTEQQRVAEFGPAMAETPEVPVSDIRSRRQINMPGGFGKDAPPMTLADQAKISAQAIDYNTIDPGLAQMLHERLVQSVDPGPNPSRLELSNRLGFGITSGNAPITKNALEHAQSRPRSEAEMQEWADLSPGYGVKLPSEERNALNRSLNEKYSIQAGERGGTGVANTANKQFVADLNKMLLDKPEAFRRGVDEPEGQFVERLMNMVRGLGAKTGSLGFAMVEPQTSNISAIDRHIADLTRELVKNEPSMREWYENQMTLALNLKSPEGAPPAQTYAEARARFAPEDADAIEAQRFRDTVSEATSTVFREAKTGEINPRVPAHLHEQPFVEPKHAQLIGPQYQAALDIMQQKGAERGIGGFSNQWFDWDYQRSRAEPHAFLNPMATEMKRMTPEEYGQVRDAFSEAGAFETKRQPETGRLKPLKPTSDYRRLIYGGASPELIATLLGGTAAGLGGAAYLRSREKENP